MAGRMSPPFPGGLHGNAQRLAEHPWLDGLARVGYAAKGVIHALIGGLALRLAVGAGGETTDSRGALRVLAEQPFSSVLLGITGAGLAAFSLWKILEAFLREGPRGHDAKAETKTAIKRIGDIAAAGVYGALALSCFELLRGRSGQGGQGLATLLEQPYGTVIAFLAGIGVLAYGIGQIVSGLKGHFLKELRTERMDDNQRTLARKLGGVGLPARGLVLTVVGFFLARAGMQARAADARGVEGALDLFAQGPGGALTLGAIAVGLLAYAAYCFVAARHRRPLAGPGSHAAT